MWCSLLALTSLLRAYTYNMSLGVFQLHSNPALGIFGVLWPPTLHLHYRGVFFLCGEVPLGTVTSRELLKIYRVNPFIFVTKKGEK